MIMNEPKSTRDWLSQFRRCSSLDTLEKVFENGRDKLTGKELMSFMIAADHRRAEITMGKFYDKVPASVWKYVK